MHTDPYLRRLGEELAARGMAEDQVRDVVAEVGGFLEDAGEDPLLAFGPPEALATRLAAADLDLVLTVRHEPMRVDPRMVEQGMVEGLSGQPVYSVGRDWESPLPADVVLDNIAKVVAGRRGRVVDSSAGKLTAELGSRAALRFFGVFLEAGRSRLPLRVEVVVTPAGGDGDRSHVAVALSEDMGRYLVKLALMTDHYRQAFEGVLAELQVATGG